MKKYIILIKITFNRIKFKLLLGNKSKIKNLFHEGNFTFDVPRKECREINIKSINLRKYCTIRIRNNGSLRIGFGTFFNSFCSINCLDTIEIGDNCIFGENVKIYDHDHRFTQKEVPFKKQGFKTQPIKIGNNCWLGSNVIVLKGSEIGNNVVIAASCVISGKIPDNSLVTQTNNLGITPLRQYENS